MCLAYETDRSRLESDIAERGPSMAVVVRKHEWLQLEEAIRRHHYWQQIVQGWLWQIPYAVVMSEKETKSEATAALPSPQALQAYSWLKEPTSSCSH
jgi:hypothetical protein